MTVPVAWARSELPVGYSDAMAFMAGRVDRIADAEAGELLWLLEHPPLYTGGVRARMDDLLVADRFPYYSAGRGGEMTYHGPGQRIVYCLLDVRTRANGDIRAFVRLLERCVIGALDRLGVAGTSDPSRPGVWVAAPGSGSDGAKIAALGLKVRRGISSHGISLNVHCDLTAFDAIVPCGLKGSAVTSLSDLGACADMNSVDKALLESFARHLGELSPPERLPFA